MKKADNFPHLTPEQRAEAEAFCAARPAEMSQWTAADLYWLMRFLTKDYVPVHGHDEDLFPDCDCVNCRYERDSKARDLAHPKQGRGRCEAT